MRDCGASACDFFYVSMRVLFCTGQLLLWVHLVSHNTEAGGGRRLQRQPGRCKLMVYLFYFSFRPLERMIRRLKPILLRFLPRPQFPVLMWLMYDLWWPLSLDRIYDQTPVLMDVFLFFPGSSDSPAPGSCCGKLWCHLCPHPWRLCTWFTRQGLFICIKKNPYFVS